MIAHVSVPARDPERVALVFAAIIDGEAFAFPPVPGAWIAVAKDRSGLAVEVYPRTMAHHPGPAEDQIHPDGEQVRPTGFHLAISTALDESQVLALARNAGWRGMVCERAGVFGVIEMWIDDTILVEVLTASEVERYRHFMTPDGCRDMFGPGTDPWTALSAPAARRT